ncbi:hypothetical protein FOT81_27125 [Raoultella planticola]|nr:hypothetical protein [Raoultella planticola]TQN55316.1 hypothetical protein FLW98_16055 [Raoultella planticola]
MSKSAWFDLQGCLHYHYDSRELWRCVEGLSAVDFSKKKMNQWIKAFPCVLNDTSDLRVIKRECYDCLKRNCD